MANNQVTFYCPLTVSTWDDDGAQEVQFGNSYLVWNEEEIREALRAEIRDGENMADYLDPPLSNKVASAEWDIAVVEGTAYGKITCELLEPLTMEEQEELAEWILGQNSDGLGEGFEQRPVKTNDGELSVHLWDFNDDYYVLPEGDFRMRLLESQAAQHKAGPATVEPQKPDCPLIGQDGNVFGLIGLAARTLRENGLHDQAKEMRTRAMGSGSYDQALGVIMDYVNPTSVYDDRRPHVNRIFIHRRQRVVHDFRSHAALVLQHHLRRHRRILREDGRDGRRDIRPSVG